MFLRATIHGAGPDKRRGVVLLAVLVVVTLLTLAAYQYSQMMMSEYKAADAYTRASQARASADAGIHYVAALLSSADAVQNTLNGNPWDNAGAFQGIVVRDSEQARFRARFSIIVPLDVDSASGGVVGANQGFRYGVGDESGKLNIAALMRIDSSGQIAKTALMKLPNMSDEASDSLLDWMDSRSTLPRASGAKDTYYSTLTPAYHCKNGPLDSIEEMLLIKGVTPELLFGNDRNRNGMLDADENDGTGVVDRGWSQYLTIYTRELNVDSTGNPRINIRDSDLQTLYTKLQEAVGDDMAAFIIAYRQYGDASSQSSGSGSGGQGGGSGQRSSGAATGSGAAGAGAGAAGAASGAAGARGAGGAGQGGGAATPRLTRGQLNLQQAGGQGGGQGGSFSTLYDLLLIPSVSIPSQPPNGQATVYPNPLSDAASIRQYFPILYDKFTTQAVGELPGRVNVLTAPRAVLAAVPGFTDSDVQAITDHRPDLSSQGIDEIYQTPSWLLTEANIAPLTLKAADRYITSRTQVYRVQAVGYFDGGGPSARIEAIIDTNAGRPRILYWRDLTELGKGYELSSNP